MLTSLALSALLWSGTAAAQAPGGDAIFVSPFQPRTPAALTTASLMTAQVEQALAQQPGLVLRPIDGLPPVSEMDPLTYAATCPQGQFVGCAFVLGDLSGAAVTVAASVETLRGRHRVEVHIVDMNRSEDVLAFNAEFHPDDEAVFAGAIARLVQAVARGEAGLVADIRAQEDPGAAAEAERERAVAAAQLAALSKEIGGSESVGSLEDREVQREKISVEDLATQMEAEATKPWERLDMRIDEYVRYRNSGLDLLAWRDRAAGRRGQLLLRSSLGYSRGPSDGAYYVIEAKSQTDLSVVQTWSWQTANSGAGLNWEVYAGWGVLPTLEAGVLFGGQTGRFTVQTGSVTEGQDLRQLPEVAVGNSVPYVGPMVLLALLPTSSFRPVVGGELRYWMGASVGDKVDQLDPSWPTYADPWMLTAGGRVGGEARMGDHLDLFVHLPFHMLVAGQTEFRTNTGQEGIIAVRPQPKPIGTFGAGVQVGVQARFFGGAKKKRGLDAYDYDPE